MGITVTWCRDCNEYRYIESDGYCRECIPFKNRLDSVDYVDVSSSINISPVDLLKNGSFTVEELCYLWIALESGSSVVFSTQSNFEDLINAISVFIPCNQKVHSVIS